MQYRCTYEPFQLTRVLLTCFLLYTAFGCDWARCSYMFHFKWDDEFQNFSQLFNKHYNGWIWLRVLSNAKTHICIFCFELTHSNSMENQFKWSANNWPATDLYTKNFFHSKWILWMNFKTSNSFIHYLKGSILQ